MSGIANHPLVGTWRIVEADLGIVTISISSNRLPSASQGELEIELSRHLGDDAVLEALMSSSTAC